jgi:hypothetical protein
VGARGIGCRAAAWMSSWACCWPLRRRRGPPQARLRRAGRPRGSPPGPAGGLLAFAASTAKRSAPTAPGKGSATPSAPYLAACWSPWVDSAAVRAAGRTGPGRGRLDSRRHAGHPTPAARPGDPPRAGQAAGSTRGPAPSPCAGRRHRRAQRRRGVPAGPRCCRGLGPLATGAAVSLLPLTGALIQPRAGRAADAGRLPRPSRYGRRACPGGHRVRCRPDPPGWPGCWPPSQLVLVSAWSPARLRHPLAPHQLGGWARPWAPPRSAANSATSADPCWWPPWPASPG